MMISGVATGLILGHVNAIVMLAQIILELVLGKHLGHGYLTGCGRIAWETIRPDMDKYLTR